MARMAPGLVLMSRESRVSYTVVVAGGRVVEGGTVGVFVVPLGEVEATI